MSHTLQLSIAQFSDRGRKEINQDFIGFSLPDEPVLAAKGAAIALADGISSSTVSQIASESAINGFLADYYCTSDAWSVKTSGQKVLDALNSWLHSQTYRSEFRYDKDKGYVCTFSALIIKSATAHVFHVGDARIYRLANGALEQLTNDHRITLSAEQNYLARALGMSAQLDLEYRSIAIETGDIFLLLTDGVYEWVPPPQLIALITQHSENLNAAAEQLVAAALANGSGDNLSAQIVRINAVQALSAQEAMHSLTQRPYPPTLDARMLFDGFVIIRALYTSARSQVFLATDAKTQAQVAIKVPSIDVRDNPAHLERFLLEEWIARRINSPYVLKPCGQNGERNFLYVAMEYIEGITLTQWMRDNPRPSLEQIRPLIDQIAKGLRAFHRLEMLHQDLRPENILIDTTGTVKIIDFGSAHVAGLAESASPLQNWHLLGTAQYTAPEYFLGEFGSARSDQFSLGVIAYQMLSGNLPYGAQVARSITAAAQGRLKYTTLMHDERAVPRWVDEAIKKAVHPNPFKRYDELSEFVHDLHHPNKDFLYRAHPPLIQRNPVAFWQGISLCLLLLVIYLGYLLSR